MNKILTQLGLLILMLSSQVVFGQTVDLTSLGAGTNNPGNGVVVTWHTAQPADGTNLVTDPTAAPTGVTYYAAFYDADAANGGTDACYSTNSKAVFTASNTCPTTTVDLTSLDVGVTNNPGSGVVVTWHTSSTATDANLVSVSGDPTAVSDGIYHAAFYDPTEMCYSTETTPVLVATIACGSCPAAAACSNNLITTAQIALSTGPVADVYPVTGTELTITSLSVGGGYTDAGAGYRFGTPTATTDRDYVLIFANPVTQVNLDLGFINNNTGLDPGAPDGEEELIVTGTNSGGTVTIGYSDNATGTSLTDSDCNGSQATISAEFDADSFGPQSGGTISIESTTPFTEINITFDYVTGANPFGIILEEVCYTAPTPDCDIMITASETDACSGETLAAMTVDTMGGTWSVVSTISSSITTAGIYTGGTNTTTANIIDSVFYSFADPSTCADTVLVTVFPQPAVTATSNSAVCLGSDVMLMSTSATAVSYSWTGPDTYTSTEEDPTIAAVTADAAGDYTVVVTDGNGCTNSATTTVVVNEIPVYTSINVDCTGSTLNSVTVNATIGSGTLEYNIDGGAYQSSNVFSPPAVQAGMSYTFGVRETTTQCGTDSGSQTISCTPTDYDCAGAIAASLDVCTFLSSNPNSTLATLDCDGGGVTNAVECFGPDGMPGTADDPATPTDPLSDNDDYDCASAMTASLDVCLYLTTNLDANIATLDCDGGGVTNAVECFGPDGIPGTADDPATPTDPLSDNDDYDCTNAAAEGLDICAYLTANPDANLATLDCDNGGVDNAMECDPDGNPATDDGSDPLVANDDYSCANAIAMDLDICTYLTANPTSALGALDCDGGGVDNATECDPDGDPTTDDGTDPNDDNDDYDCASASAAGLDICAYLAMNSDANLATLDCDNGGVDNITECTLGPDGIAGNGDETDPSIADDDYNCDNAETTSLDICAYLLTNPTSALGALDCDGGGVDNATECDPDGDPTTDDGTDPNDDNDDYDCASATAAGLDICAYLVTNPDANLATLDCDNGGVDNITECTLGPDGIAGNGDETDPSSADDDYNCDNAESTNLDICAYLGANPTSALGALDCDGGGVDNATECDPDGDPTTDDGTDPNDDNDDYDCTSASAANLDICGYLAMNPDANLATLDCDNGGVDNITECTLGPDGLAGNGDETDPSSADDDYNCDNAESTNLDICAYLLTNPTSALGALDCDGGGVDNATECDPDGDPTTDDGTDPNDDNDDYDCTNAAAEGLDICAYLTSNPDANLATLDCDNGGVDNITECTLGPDGIAGNGDETDPSSADDDYNCDNAESTNLDICTYLAANPTSALGALDCDGGGVDNATECDPDGDPTTDDGTDPNDDNDDYDCTNAAAEGLDICAYLTSNPDANLATLDCDNGGVDNITECTLGPDGIAGNGDETDPSSADDDYNCDNAESTNLDICAYLLTNPTSALGALDCDGGGVDNATECDPDGDPTTDDGTDPNDDNDDYDCASAAAEGLDICAYLAMNSDANLATLDCDNGGVDNATECDPDGNPATDDGSDPLVANDDYSCANAIAMDLDICAYLAANPTSALGALDCDGGGVDNATECDPDGDPTTDDGTDPNDDNDDYDCTNAAAEGLDICAYLTSNPDANLATLDCDNGGVDNITECTLGPDGIAGNGDETDPSSADDDYNCDNAESTNLDICTYLAANPTSALGALDCDGGGVDNATECDPDGDPTTDDGTDPNDDNDDYDCTNAAAEGLDICTYLTSNPDANLATLDCDNGGVDNITECTLGPDGIAGNGDETDPSSADDDYNCDNAESTNLDICAYLLTNPTSALGALDCDGGGVDNATECDPDGDPTTDDGTDPNDDNDDYDCASAAAEGLDICTYLAMNSDANLATLDCDNGGVDNITECTLGPDGIAGNGDETDPSMADDDYNCDNAESTNLDICAYLLTNPTSGLATLDCDGGGVDNATECDPDGDPTTDDGTDPNDDNDDYDCANAAAEGLDICAYLVTNPDANLATLDCDNGGVDNITECTLGPDGIAGNGDETDPSSADDDYNCDNAESTNLDICAYLLTNPTSGLATLDCDGGGVDNATECDPDGDPTTDDGTDPNDDNDDYDCANAAAEGLDICAYLTTNPDANLATQDCDNGGVDNITECTLGPDGIAGNGDETDPSMADDDYNCDNAESTNLDICAYLLTNPTSGLATLDCDGGGVDNATECDPDGDPTTDDGTDPNDDNDDYDCASALAAGLDICLYLASNSDANLATLDCDMGGVDNATECDPDGDPNTDDGTNPNDPTDDYNCDDIIESGLDICAYIAANPTSEIATIDCDGGGVDNATECDPDGDPNTDDGTDPLDDNDDYNCASASAVGLDICAYLAMNSDANLATLDCDNGGVDNITECTLGPDGIAGNGDETDPSMADDDYNCDNSETTSLDICAYLLTNPTSGLATLDCDGGGVDNATECDPDGDPTTDDGTDPNDDNDDYDCASASAAGLDICAYLAMNSDANLATLDCDNGGVDNITECTLGPDGIAGNGDETDPSMADDDYNCDNSETTSLDICAYLLTNPTSGLATLDCDGGGVDNATECDPDGDPTTDDGTDPNDDNDDYDCASASAAGLDICAYLAMNSDANLATLDCDNGGVDNITECTLGPDGIAGNGDETDPSMADDDYNCDNAESTNLDICAYLLTNPTSGLATLDCDNGGVDNATECDPDGDPTTDDGSDPLDDTDDYNCANAITLNLDVCAYLAINPDSDLATLDCDNGGVDNITECTLGYDGLANNGDETDPLDGDDDYDCESAMDANLDICAYLATNPTANLATKDCDGGGVDNATECDPDGDPTTDDGSDPLDDTDDYNCANAITLNLDVCAYLAINPDSDLATLDCDNGGVDNITECTLGYDGLANNGDETDPLDGDDDYDCESAMDANLDICVYLATNPTANLATEDCDGGGVDNATECDPDGDPTTDDGSDPLDDTDDYNCENAVSLNLDICLYLTTNPDSDLATLDCDNGGVDNITECTLGPDGLANNGDETDPLDGDDDYDCESAMDANLDICLYLSTHPTANLATLDCDGGGINNATECDPDGDPTTDDGTDPLDANDDYNCENALSTGLNICEYIALNPDSDLVTLDCDMGGVDNATECDPDGNPNTDDGTDPLSDDDDYNCENAMSTGLDICAYIATNPGSNLATLDCDNGGVDNATECDPDGDPNTDDGTDPLSDDDDYNCENAMSTGLDICAYIATNPGSNLATLDCDNGGVDNATECDPDGDPNTDDGTDPLSDDDDYNCENAMSTGLDICAYIATNPGSNLATLDCDNGGVDNATECDPDGDPNTDDGTDPLSDDDDYNCENAMSTGLDICAYIATNPGSNLATLDCDNGGVDNATECDPDGDPNTDDGTDPLSDDDDYNCENAMSTGLDICAYIATNPGSNLATLDCDNGGIDNATECDPDGDPNTDDGTDPLSDDDDYNCENAMSTGLDICAYIATNPGSNLATLDCDNGGIDNATECDPDGDPNTDDGTDPLSDDDDYNCENAMSTGLDICAYIATNPGSNLATLDCDNGGVDNATECDPDGDPNTDDGTDPLSDDDDYNCENAMSTGLDICAYIATNPGSNLATLDCDNGGIDNATECDPDGNPNTDDGTDPLSDDDDYNCENAMSTGLDICAYIATNPGSNLATLDCDNGGIDNATECDPDGDPNTDDGTDPLSDDDDYNCENAMSTGLDICAYIATNPGSNLATLDCDNGGVDNATECDPDGDPNTDDGTDPLSDDDDYNCENAMSTGLDICAYIATNPGSNLATLDCDNGGVDNATECDPDGDPNTDDGTDPLSDDDDYNCENAMSTGLDICAYIATNPGSNLATLDCDNGGVDNATECDPDGDPNTDDGTDPLSDDDDYNCENAMSTGLDICAYIATNPGSNLATLDCDNGGIDNATECDPDGDPNTDDGTDPLSDDDDYNCENAMSTGLDICAYIATNPGSNLATLDCDNGGIDNATECDPDGDPNTDDGTDPLSDDDDYNCENAMSTGLDICAYIATNPGSNLATLDCDNGGVDNATECDPDGDPNTDDGTDPLSDDDDYNCENAMSTGLDICAYIATNPGSNLAMLDCDNGGVDNISECHSGSDPLDPSDDLSLTVDVNSTYVDIPVTGNVATNDPVIPAGSTYGNPLPNSDNPGSSLPVVNDDGSYTFESSVPGVFVFQVPLMTMNGDIYLVDLIITVLDPNGTNNPPVTNVDIGNTLADMPIILMTLSNDFPGVEGVVLVPSTVEVIMEPTNGMTTVDPVTGNVTYIPNSGFVGTDTLTYQVFDSNGNVSTAQQIVTVLSENAPNSTVAADDNVATPNNTPVSGNVLINDNDPEGDDQVVTPQVTTVPGVGTLTLLSDGSYEFIPEDGYVGPVDFPYEVTDENGATSMATLHILVRPPVAMVSGFMWEDLNGDGLQDPNEPGIPGLMVVLYDIQGDVSGVAVTDENGMYTFMNVEPDMYYYVEVDIDNTDYSLTTQDAGNNDSIDSDLQDQLGTITSGLFFLEQGEEEIIDGGFYECFTIGEFVWYDINENDIADPEENGINGLEVNLYVFIDGSYELIQTTITDHKPGTPSDDGWFNFCAPGGMRYYVEVVMPPYGLVQVLPNVGNNDLIDSDLTNANGEGTTNSFVLNNDISNIGAGFYPMATAGNRVWEDTNEDGIQDDNEPSVADVKVEAFEAETGKKIAEDVTNFAGVYSIEYLQKKDYYLRFTPPSGLGYGFTIPNTGGELNDSDVDHSYGFRTTAAYSMEPGNNYINIDAGLRFGVLPVTWLDVRAENKGSINVVSWKTASEVNNDFFVIERRLEGNDKYVEIGELDGQGESTEVVTYEFNDDKISTGIHYYRIKQVDNDGKSSYSDVVSVDVKSDKNIISLSPNPSQVKSILEFDLARDAKVEVKVLSTDGKLIQSYSIESTSQTGNRGSVTIENLPVGVYMIHVEQGSFKDVKRLIVVR